MTQHTTCTMSRHICYCTSILVIIPHSTTLVVSTFWLLYQYTSQYTTCTMLAVSTFWLSHQHISHHTTSIFLFRAPCQPTPWRYSNMRGLLTVSVINSISSSHHICILWYQPWCHNYIRHNYIGHNHVSHKYIDHNYIGHNVWCQLRVPAYSEAEKYFSHVYAHFYTYRYTCVLCAHRYMCVLCAQVYTHICTHVYTHVYTHI